MSGGLDPARTAGRASASEAAVSDETEHEVEVAEVEVADVEVADVDVVDVEVVEISVAEPQPPRWLRPMRNAVRRLPGGALIWKIIIGVVGAAIVALGLALIPLPGPGWAIVFLGVAVWATEYAWAYRLLLFGRRTLKAWTDWLLRQGLFVRGLVGLAGLVLLAALGFGGWYFFIR
jgi:uncharacterized protein (TIGR02611 family)